MKEKFLEYGLELNDEQLTSFKKFLEIFIQTNSQINLSAIRDEAGIIEKHFIDSIMLTKFSSFEGKILDLGTGGWFPGIPLSIMNQGKNVEFTLVDSIGKKVKVVNQFIEQLGLKNIQAIQARAEDLGQDKAHRAKYNMIVSRATAYLPTLLEYTIPLLSVWWIFISYKLDNDEEIQKATRALDLLNAEVLDVLPYEVNGQKRVFLVIQKIGETHKKYPRMTGEPLKNPL